PIKPARVSILTWESRPLPACCLLGTVSHVLFDRAALREHSTQQRNRADERGHAGIRCEIRVIATGTVNPIYLVGGIRKRIVLGVIHGSFLPHYGTHYPMDGIQV